MSSARNHGQFSGSGKKYPPPSKLGDGCDSFATVDCRFFAAGWVVQSAATPAMDGHSLQTARLSRLSLISGLRPRVLLQ